MTDGNDPGPFRALADAAAAYRDAVQAKLIAAYGRSDGAIAGATIAERQIETHGFAWIATYVAALEGLACWVEDLSGRRVFGGIERAIAAIGGAEYALQLAHGIAMSQDEIVRPMHFGAEAEAASFLAAPAVAAIVAEGASPQARRVLVDGLRAAGPESAFLHDGLDETAGAIRAQFRRYVAEHVVDAAPDWHARDTLIPDAVIRDLAGLGVFGMTVAERYGGADLGTTAMCVVTEELSRGYIGVGSLGTRAEIACELIRLAGTEDQKAHYLPRIAAGEIIPTAVFTEPETGSNLAALRTRAERDGEAYRIYGNKTWITHAGRADLMTLLARTDPNEPGHAGLTMFLAEKPRGRDGDSFPVEGLSGSEIEVLGYRGMKEYELAFDGFRVPATQVLGGREGDGFRHLMRTFESARIQTAARAIGVGQNAFDLAFSYAVDRRQFDRPIAGFERIAGKLAWMVAELVLVRQLTYGAARRHESGARSDVEAGMAKLLAARVAWSCADNAVQVHGGNGYATEYPISRVLCDARILNIFEGAAEIQAAVIARGLLGGGRKT